GGTVTSSDGIEWVPHQTGTIDYVNGLGYGNGQFVAVGDKILTSTDGINWVQRFSAPAHGNFAGIAYGNGQFVAVGPQDTNTGSGDRVTATSADGINWAPHQWQLDDDDFGRNAVVSGIAYGNGQFVTVGSTFDDPPSIHTSSDGVHWVARQSTTQGGWSLNGIAFA